MTPRWTIMHKLFAAAVLAVALAGATAAPAFADGDGWRKHEWREHEWREHHGWRPYGYYAPRYPYYPGYYAPPPAVYVPPAPVYVPPPAPVYVPAPSLNIVIPIH